MESSAERLLALISASRPETGEEGEIPGAALAEYSVEARRKQKMLCSQLQVLHFLLEFLEQEDPASWEVDPEMLSQEVDEVKQQWKALKTEYQEKVKDITDLLPDLLHKQQLLQERKRRLEGALHQYRLQREAADSMMQIQGEQERQLLQDLLQDKRESRERCWVHIHQLEGEIRRLDESAESWIQASLWSSAFSGLLQVLQGVSFVSVAQNVLVLDLNVDLVLETPEPDDKRVKACPASRLHIPPDVHRPGAAALVQGPVPVGVGSLAAEPPEAACQRGIHRPTAASDEEQRVCSQYGISCFSSGFHA